MKAITLWQPYASLVICGYKKFETRSWSTNYRGELAIHAAQRKVDNFATHPEIAYAMGNIKRMHDIYLVDDLPRGVILGTVTLDSVEPTDGNPPIFDIPIMTNVERLAGDFSLGRYAWLLLYPKKFKYAIPARGYQRLWNWESIT